MNIVLLESYIKEIILEEKLSNKLLSEGKILDWVKNKFKSAYSYFVYDEELVNMCLDWLEKNKRNQKKSANKRRASYKNAINKQEDKRARFVLISTAILMTLVINYDKLTKNNKGFSEAYNTVTRTIDSDIDGNAKDTPSENYSNDDYSDDYNSNTSKMIKATNRELINLNPNEKVTIFKLFGIETEDSFFQLIRKNSAKTFDEMSEDSFDNHIKIINNLLETGRLTDNKEIDATIMMLLNAKVSNKGNSFRKEIDNAYTDLSNYQEVNNTIENIAKNVESLSHLENLDELKEKADDIFNKRISSIEDQIQKESNSEKPDNIRIQKLQNLLESLYEKYDNIFEI
jgi:hypothetical protein